MHENLQKLIWWFGFDLLSAVVRRTVALDVGLQGAGKAGRQGPWRPSLPKEAALWRLQLLLSQVEFQSVAKES